MDRKGKTRAVGTPQSSSSNTLAAINTSVNTTWPVGGDPIFNTRHPSSSIRSSFSQSSNVNTQQSLYSVPTTSSSSRPNNAGLYMQPPGQPLQEPQWPSYLEIPRFGNAFQHQPGFCHDGLGYVCQNPLPGIHTASNPVQSFVREGPKLAWHQHEAHTNNCGYNSHPDSQTWPNGGMSVYPCTGAPTQQDYFSYWSQHGAQQPAVAETCTEPEAMLCCNEPHCEVLDDPYFQKMCTEDCPALCPEHMPKACYQQHCDAAPCPDSHGGRLVSLEPCFESHIHQEVVPCTDPTCANPDTMAGFDEATISAAAQLATMNKAKFTANSLHNQTLYEHTLNQFTHLREDDAEATIEHTDFDVDQGPTSDVDVDVDDDEDSDTEVTEAGPSTKRKVPRSYDPAEQSTTISSQELTEPIVCEWVVNTDTNQTCGRSFTRTEALHNHVDKEHIDKLLKDDSQCFRCQWADCKRTEDQTFSAKPKLKRHVQTHTHHKPYKCEYCNTNMKTKDALEKHRRTHTGEAPYSCDKCDKTFKTSTEHKTHMTAVHSDEKPHQCPHCGQRFADSSNLSKHKKTHYKGSWKCLQPGCKAEMKRWDQIRRHFMTQKHCLELLVEGSAEQSKYKKDMQDRWNALPESEKLLPVEKKSTPPTQALPTPAPSRPSTVVQGEGHAAVSGAAFFPDMQHSFAFVPSVPFSAPMQQQYLGNQGLHMLSVAAQLPGYQAPARQAPMQPDNKRPRVRAA